MCLNIHDNTKAKIAEKDITVYKHIIALGDGTFETSYQHTEIVIGETYSSKIKRDPWGIEKALHSYKNLEDAENNSYGEPVIECIIPKGATYYEGTFINKPAYASNQLKYVKLYETT